MLEMSFCCNLHLIFIICQILSIYVYVFTFCELSSNNSLSNTRMQKDLNSVSKTYGSIAKVSALYISKTFTKQHDSP